ncbi:MAG TPA: Clp protease ClpP [Flavobacteriaceae bacterium]|nr:Clp protease ClpP [Flavobacteriaceae bacterium]
MNGNIYINGCIGTFLDENGNVKEKGVELIDVIMQVKNQPKATSFTVYINSPGGYVDTGFDIYDYLKSLNKPIKTVGQGMVASIATVIYMAGDQRMLRPNTEFMIHLPAGGVEGTASEIEGYSKYLKETEKRILKFYEQTAGLTENEIMPLLRNETFLNSDEALKLGFATEKTIASQAVAYFKTNPKQKKMSKKENGIIAKMKAILSGLPITNKIVFDAEGNELDFYELEDDATIEVGAKANYDGKAAEGEFKVPSDDDPEIVLTYIFESGVLTEIIVPEVENADDDELTALKAENESLKTQLAEKETEVTALGEEVTALKGDNKTYKKAFAAIKALESEKEPKQSTKQKQSNQPAARVNRIAEGITNLKNKK